MKLSLALQWDQSETFSGEFGCVNVCVPVQTRVCVNLKSADYSRFSEGVADTQKYESLILFITNSEKTLELWSVAAHLIDIIINPCWFPLPELEILSFTFQQNFCQDYQIQIV